jgi:hypothetical protein
MGFKWYSFLPISKYLLCQVRPNGCPSGVDNILLGSSSPNILLLEVGPNWVHKTVNFLPLPNTKKRPFTSEPLSSQTQIFQTKCLVIEYIFNTNQAMYQTLTSPWLSSCSVLLPAPVWWWAYLP